MEQSVVVIVIYEKNRKFFKVPITENKLWM